MAEMVIAGDEGVPQPSLGGAGDGLDAQRGRTASNDVGGSNSDGGSVSGEGEMGFLGPGRLRAGGSAITPSRCMRSSATGERITIAASSVPSFKASKALRDAVRSAFRGLVADHRGLSVK